MPPTAPPTTQEKVVDLIQRTSEVVKIASATITDQEKTAAAVGKLIPGVVKALVDNERIDASQAEKVAKALVDPINALKLLEKLAAHRNASELQHLGTAVTKTAAAAGDRSNRVGERTSQLRPSDALLFSGLGLQVPTE